MIQQKLILKLHFFSLNIQTGKNQPDIWTIDRIF